jgi:hypothetical protein
MGLKLNGTPQLLAYADDVDLLGDSIDTMKKNTETLIDASKEADLKVNSISYQNAEQIHYIKIASRSYDNTSQFKYLGTTVTNQNLIQEEIK